MRFAAITPSLPASTPYGHLR
uniref:Uncharacterized protein n=1 Tax=Arundo donax TaxID=35708 RepID=A0A0A8Y0C9_ARUDO